MWFVGRDDEDSAHSHQTSRAGRADRRCPLRAHAGTVSFAVTPGITGLVT